MRKSSALPAAVSFVLGCLASGPVGAAPSFSEAYRSILEKSLRLETQKLEIEASRQRRLGQWGRFTPSLELSYTDSKIGETLPTHLRGASLDASVNLFRSFGDVAGARAAELSVEGNREKLLSERQGAELDALEVLIGALAKSRERKINERTVEMRADSLRIARERYAKGLLALQETEKVAIDLDIARAALANAVAQESEARAALLTALGQDGISGADWPWREEITGSAIERLSFSLDSRPDWRSAQASVQEERQKKRQALGTLLPTLDFKGSYGTFDLDARDRRDWKAVWVLTVPLFSGFKDYSAYRVQGLDEQQARIRLETLRRRVPPEIESLRLSFTEARSSALAREKTAKLTEKLYADNLQRFRLGRVNANELAQDLDRLLRSQLQEVEGWTSAHLSFARLCHGLGRFVSSSGRCETSPE